MFYKAIVQSVLLFGSETWNLTASQLQALTGFHHRVARRLSGRMPYRDAHLGRWVYPLIEEALEIAGLSPLEEYILQCRWTIFTQVQQ